MNEARAAWEAWREKRHVALTGPQGNLALVQTVWLHGDPGEVSLDEALRAGPTTLTGTTQKRHDFQGNLLEQGYRLWDAASEAIRAFETVSAYEYNPEWVLEGVLELHAEPEPFPFEFTQPGTEARDLAVPGDIRVTIAGEDYHLSAFDNDGVLQLVFADTTSTSGGSYPTGRFLYVQRVAGSNRVMLDFNQAFVPPCGFSVHFNCPLPPARNRIRTAIEAGERFPSFRDGYAIH